MSIWGCSLDDAYGQQTIKVKRKKKLKMISPDKLQLEDLDSKFNQSGIQPNDSMNSSGAELAERETQQETKKTVQQKPSSSMVEITNEEYLAFKEYQKQRYLQAKQRVFEGYQNLQQPSKNFDDDFNDVLLFGLTGIFFLIFIDYIYKLGKKSY
jgi:hypothetical protein